MPFAWKETSQSVEDNHYDDANLCSVILQLELFASSNKESKTAKETVFLQHTWPCSFVQLLLLWNSEMPIEHLLTFSIQRPRPKNVGGMDRYDLLDAIVPPHIMQPLWNASRLKTALPKMMHKDTILETLSELLSDNATTSPILLLVSRDQTEPIRRELWTQRRFLQCTRPQQSWLSISSPTLQQSLYYHKRRVEEMHDLRFVNAKKNVKDFLQPWFWCESCAVGVRCEDQGFWECKCRQPIILCQGCVERQTGFPTLWDDCLLWEQRRHAMYRDNFSCQLVVAPPNPNVETLASWRRRTNSPVRPSPKDSPSRTPAGSFTCPSLTDSPSRKVSA